MAEHFQVHKTTATYHLEKAVKEGELVRFYAWTDAEQTGWAYRRADTIAPLPFEDSIYDEPGFEEYHPDAVMETFFSDVGLPAEGSEA